MPDGVTTACPRCGGEAPPEARFCPACGTALAAPLPREERKIVTVLFADLVGSTARAETLDPEDVRAILAPYYARLRTELERFGGTVEKFIGDAVVAVFGAPVAHEDDPERAVRSALAIRDWVLEEQELQVRIAVHTGEALVSLGARPVEGEGMVAGDVVNTAARLQAAAPVNGILVGEQTYRATERVIEYRAAEPVVAKGKAEPIPVRVAVQARSRFGVDVRRTEATELVGRTRELTVLTEALARVKEDTSPQLVTLVGVPGIGKSRLVWELFRHIETGSQGLVTWRQGRSLPYGEGVALWALGEIVKAQSGLLETDSEDEAATKLAAAVRALVVGEGDAAWIERQLRPLVGLERDGGADRGEAFAAWRRFLEALAVRRPLVLVLEDVHWADDGLLDFVDHLVDWATGVPLLVVATARPELLARRPSWGGGKSNAVTLSLAPLSNDETARLVRALLDRSALDAGIQRTLLDRAEGNPLYAEEFARLVAAGREPVELPETVQGIVAARLDVLSVDEKRLLQDASVLGKVFWLGALAALSGSERRELEERLHALERQEFVRRERVPSVAGELEYAFRHILVRDVAYAQIPRAERGDKHLLAAEWIELLGRPEDHAELLAHHLRSALELAAVGGADTRHLADRARVALRDAGDHALALHGYRAAARLYEAAIELWPGANAELPELLFGFARTLAMAGDERSPEALERARDALVAARGRGRAAEAATLLAELWWTRGDVVQSRVHLGQAATLVAGEVASPSKAWVLSQLSRYLALAGDTDAAIARGEEALELAQALELEEVRAHALNNIGLSRHRRRDPGGGLAELEQSVELAREINSPELSRGLNNLAQALSDWGHVGRSGELRREAVRAGERLGNFAAGRHAQSMLIWWEYALGNWDEFLEQTSSFLDESARLGGGYQDAVLRARRAVILVGRDQDAEAAADASRALERAREIGDPQVVHGVLAHAAFVECELGQLETARAHAIEGMWAPTDLPLLALTARRLGIEQVLREFVAEEPEEDLWVPAVRAVLDGDDVTAAERYRDLGVPTFEAHARLHAAADAQVAEALAFFRRVRATRYIRQAEGLLAATA
jgi:class 3 adenylate cyclase/tetratricopeptide (TPR) repeat protein